MENDREISKEVKGDLSEKVTLEQSGEWCGADISRQRE